MYPNAHALREGLTPLELEQPRLAAILTAEHLQRRVIDRGAATVAEIADAWNSGSHRDALVPLEYIAKVEAIYSR